MLSARPSIVLPQVLTRLAKSTLTPFRSHAIAGQCVYARVCVITVFPPELASAVGDELSTHLAAMLPLLVREAADCAAADGSSARANDERTARLRRERGEAALSAACALVAHAADEASANEASTLLLDSLRTRDTPSVSHAALRSTAAQIVAALCAAHGASMNAEQRQRLLSELVPHLTDAAVSVQSAVSGALAALVNATPKDALFELLDTLRSTLADVSIELQRVELTARGVAITALTFNSSVAAPAVPVVLPGLA
jgi:hypothetical protein